MRGAERDRPDDLDPPEDHDELRRRRPMAPIAVVASTVAIISDVPYDERLWDLRLYSAGADVVPLPVPRDAAGWVADGADTGA